MISFGTTLRRNGDKVPSDQRILGSGEFVEELLLEAEKREKETLRLSRRVRGLHELMREIVKGEGIEEGGLRSGGRGKEVIRVRRIFCQLAVKRMGYPGAEVARYLGVTTSAVNRLAVRRNPRSCSNMPKLLQNLRPPSASPRPPIRIYLRKIRQRIDTINSWAAPITGSA
jgi:hypothetical protein